MITAKAYKKSPKFHFLLKKYFLFFASKLFEHSTIQAQFWTKLDMLNLEVDIPYSCRLNLRGTSDWLFYGFDENWTCWGSRSSPQTSQMLLLKMSQLLIKHISTNFLNFGTKSCQSRYLFWLVSKNLSKISF